MAQGYILVNSDKKEYVSPHDLGLGYSSLELDFAKPDFAGSLVQFAHELVATGGRWHGDRVLYVGDYGDNIHFSLESTERLEYDFVIANYTRLDKAEVRAWVMKNASSESIEFRQRLWATYDELDKVVL